MDRDLITDVLVPAFWYTGEQLVKLIVPIIVISIVLGFTSELILGDRKR